MLVLNRPVDYDNRAENGEDPCGFVYLSDGTRLVYGLGKVHSKSAPIELRELAVEYLASQDITVTLL